MATDFKKQKSPVVSLPAAEGDEFLHTYPRIVRPITIVEAGRLSVYGDLSPCGTKSDIIRNQSSLVRQISTYMQTRL